MAQMSDTQIVEYISEGVSNGKSQSQIGTELLAKGVSATQIKRLMQKYQSGSSETMGTVQKTRRLGAGERTRSKKGTLLDDSENEMFPGSKESLSDSKEALGEGRIPRRGLQEDELPDSLRKDFLPLYGMQIFSNRKLTFEPNENAATPSSYVLGPGDEVLIDIWGENEASISETITPEGRIMISQVGPISLSGLTVAEATVKIRRSLSKIYSSVAGGSSSISVSLGKIRTIQVSILGEVKTPGTYRLSSFTTLFNALYRAGGVTPLGSLRGVKIVREGREVACVDVYKFIFDGKSDTDCALRDGDAVIVPPYSAVVAVTGGVRRPMRYEVSASDGVDDLIRYAGGFRGDADTTNVLVVRTTPDRKRAYTVAASDFEGFRLRDCDSLVVNCNTSREYANIVEVKGAVYRPGKFELGRSIATVRQLVEAAGGLRDDAFPGRAQILREKADRTLEVLSVPLKRIVDGDCEDELLRRGDVLIISCVSEMEETGFLTISGFVKSPGKYEYAEGTTVEDLIMMAGGLIDGASLVRVDVSRSVSDPMSVESKESLADAFTLSIKDGLVIEGETGFKLMRYDVVAVRKSPTYVAPKTVTVSGEVTFPGQYTLLSSNERISDVIARAGGITVRGLASGGMLRRQVDQYERNVRKSISQLARQNTGKDSLHVEKLKISEIYNVGVEIDKALKHPGSEFDMVLRDGDEIIIPPVPTTVRMQGEVLYPNTVQYIPGRSVRYYVRQSGGFSLRARRHKVYVVHENGLVSVGLASKVDPGCEIVVPSRPDHDKMTTSEWLGIGTTATSITTMIATIVNMFN